MVPSDIAVPRSLPAAISVRGARSLATGTLYAEGMQRFLDGVFDRLLNVGATIIVIDHDLDLLAAADRLIDMGPGGGPDGGQHDWAVAGRAPRRWFRKTCPLWLARW